jgi:hypothetical protein
MEPEDRGEGGGKNKKMDRGEWRGRGREGKVVKRREGKGKRRGKRTRR